MNSNLKQVDVKYSVCYKMIPFVCDTCGKVFGWHHPFGIRIDIELKCKSCYKRMKLKVER